MFKKEKGVSISNYILQKRVDEAKKLLCGSSLPINTVSLHIGYSNFSYFTKMFKENTGLTPLEYRRKFGEEYAYDRTEINRTLAGYVTGRKSKSDEPGDRRILMGRSLSQVLWRIRDLQKTM